ncbi:hypothetical protein Q31a_27600 [Aureliella helgolandensis]|uniref:Uncharacterized protein n=1 Tax=Aureliella helgolandensis TaxID=2527968 RepID=A0A518G777_9BACT|nr:hypothetical protein Q31a_27600 [Aureliella helgolandensis]
MLVAQKASRAFFSLVFATILDFNCTIAWHLTLAVSPPLQLTPNVLSPAPFPHLQFRNRLQARIECEQGSERNLPSLTLSHFIASS